MNHYYVCCPTTNAKISVEEFYNIKFNSIDGNKIPLNDYRDKTFLVVNTIILRIQDSLLDCKIFGANTKDGLIVIGVPSNDFNQEAKTNTEVKTFVKLILV